MRSRPLARFTALLLWLVLTHCWSARAADQGDPAPKGDEPAQQQVDDSLQNDDAGTDRRDEEPAAGEPSSPVEAPILLPRRTRNFRPSEQITVDNAVPYPVDI